MVSSVSSVLTLFCLRRAQRRGRASCGRPGHNIVAFRRVEDLGVLERRIGLITLESGIGTLELGEVRVGGLRAGRELLYVWEVCIDSDLLKPDGGSCSRSGLGALRVCTQARHRPLVCALTVDTLWAGQ